MTPRDECRQLIARLELISHAPAKNPDPTRQSTDAKGGTRPPGGIDRKDDREPEFLAKSYVHFRRCFDRCRVDADYRALAADARRALKAWQHPPPPPRDTEAWQDLVARDPRKAKVVAAEWGITAQYVYLLRRKRERAA